MPDVSLPILENSVLWQVRSFGRQIVPAGTPYWWDNRRRDPHGLVVLQIVEAGGMILRTFHDDDHTDELVATDEAVLFAMDEPTAYGHIRPSAEPMINRWLNLAGAGLPEHWALLRAAHGSVMRAEVGSPLRERFDETMALADPAAGTPARRVAGSIHRLVEVMLDQAESSRSRSLSPVDRAVQALLDQPARPWSLKELASAHGVSREHLTRTFIDQVGESPGAYQQAARLRRAIELLRESDLPLAEVARQSGLGTARTLNRLMHQSHGCTAGQWRERSRQGNH